MNIKNRFLKKVASYTLGIIIALNVICPVTAFATRPEKKIVRVGYVNAATYEEGGDGEYKRGSGYEYLQKYLIIPVGNTSMYMVPSRNATKSWSTVK